MSGQEVRTAQEWCDLLGARVMDPDGWRDGTRAWDDQITRDEFDRRLIHCTIDGRGYPMFVGRVIPTAKRVLMTEPHDGHPDTEECPGCPHAPTATTEAER